MYAIAETGGKQYKVSVDDVVLLIILKVVFQPLTYFTLIISPILNIIVMPVKITYCFIRFFLNTYRFNVDVK